MQATNINNDLYIPLLASVQIYPDQLGGLVRRTGTSEKICELGTKRLILPTEANLTKHDAETTVFFHPMSENIVRGDSPVFNYLKLAMSLRVNYTITSVASMLLTIATDPEIEGRLKSNQLDLIRRLPKVNDKTLLNLVNSFKHLDVDKNLFFSVYNKRNGKIGQTPYNRVAVVRFPLIEQLLNVDKSEYWSAAKVRKSDILAYQALFGYMIPDWNAENQYSGYSDSLDAPAFHALCQAFVNVMTRMNELCNLFGEFADTTTFACPEIHVVDQAISDLGRFAGLINPLDGNIGDIAENRQRVDQLQTQPLGVPPANLINAADQKAAAMATSIATPSTNTPTAQASAAASAAHMTEDKAAANPATAANGGYIGIPMYNPWGGFTAVDPQKAIANAVEEQKKRLAADPITAWTVATNPMAAYAMTAQIANPIMQQQVLQQQIMQQQAMQQQQQQQAMLMGGMGFGVNPMLAQQQAIMQQQQQQAMMAAMGANAGVGMAMGGFGMPRFKAAQ